jgi:exopolysaccharide production protein ExoQ
MGSLGVFTAVAMLARAISTRRFVAACLSILLIAIDVLVVASARSAGANAAASVAVLVLLAWTMSRILPVVARTTIFIGSLLVATLAAVTRNIWYDAIFQEFLAASGKDSDLTGRTYIWSRAELFVHQNPMLGRGYAAFWRVGDLEAEAIWEKMFVANRIGFNFHNSIYEILVHLGYVGLILFGAVFIFAAARLFLKVMRAPTHLGILFCTLIVYDGLRFQFESLPLGIFAHNTLFLYAALGFGFSAMRDSDTDHAFPDRHGASGAGTASTPARQGRG